MSVMIERSSSYRNNPLKVFPDAVNITKLIDSENEQEQEFQHLLEIIREILVDEPRWSTIQRHEVKITPLLGGITNQLLLIERQDAISSADKLVFRLFGEQTVEFIHRPMENTVFAKLSVIEFGPIFYGTFLNGRIEGYLPGTNLTPEQMTIEPNNQHIAIAVAQLHSFQFPEVQYLSSIRYDQLIKLNFEELELLTSESAAKTAAVVAAPTPVWLWTKIELFFDIVKNLTFPTEKQQQQYENLNLSNMLEELHWLKRNTQQLHQQLVQWSTTDSATIRPDNDRLLGRLFALEEVLCHNDLLSGNIMKVRQEGRIEGENEDNIIKLIDYEYAATNYRGYDVANHFCEYCGFEFDVRNSFPKKESRMTFIKSYIGKSIPTYCENDLFAEGIDDIILYFTLASNLFWGTWSIVQAKGSTIDFDYLRYAALRYEGYFYQKSLFYDHNFYFHP